MSFYHDHSLNSVKGAAVDVKFGSPRVVMEITVFLDNGYLSNSISASHGLCHHPRLTQSQFFLVGLLLFLDSQAEAWGFFPTTSAKETIHFSSLKREG